MEVSRQPVILLSQAMLAGIQVSKPMKYQMLGFTADGHVCACPLGAALLGVGWTVKQLQEAVRDEKHRALLSECFPVLDEPSQPGFIRQLKGDPIWQPMPLRHLIVMANGKWHLPRESIASALQKCGV